MKDSKRIVSRNANQGSSAQTGFQSVPSREGVGHQSVYAASVGAREKSATRFRAEASPTDSRRSHGGQASGPGLFGLSAARRTSQPVSAPQAPKVRPPGDDQPRRVGNLSFGQRRARWSTLPASVVEAMHQAAAEADRLARLPEPDLGEWDRALPYGSVETALAIND